MVRIAATGIVWMELKYCHIEFHVRLPDDVASGAPATGLSPVRRVGRVHHVLLRFRQRGPSDTKPGGSVAQYFTNAISSMRAMDALLSQLPFLTSVIVESEIDLLAQLRTMTGTSGIFGNGRMIGSTSCSRALETAQAYVAGVGTVRTRFASPFWCLSQYENERVLWTTWETSRQDGNESVVGLHQVPNDLPRDIRFADAVPWDLEPIPGLDLIPLPAGVSTPIPVRGVRYKRPAERRGLYFL